MVEVGIYQDEHLKLHDVAYKRRPPKVNAFHRLIHRFSYSEEEDHYDVPLQLGVDAPDKEENDVGLIKYSDWRYEQEVRAFFPNIGALSSDIRVLNVLPENIRGLIFGPRMSSVDKARAVLCCHLMRESAAPAESQTKDVLCNFVFFEAGQTVSHFGFEILPIGVLGGLYLFDHLPLKRLSDLDEPIAGEVREMARSSRRVTSESFSERCTLSLGEQWIPAFGRGCQFEWKAPGCAEILLVNDSSDLNDRDGDQLRAHALKGGFILDDWEVNTDFLQKNEVDRDLPWDDVEVSRPNRRLQ